MANSTSSNFLLLLLLAISSIAIGSSSSSFSEENPLRMVPDRLREIESSVLQAIGHTRHALSFARYINRYGKRYETVEEMKLRFEIFRENLKLIRSTNKKQLTYRLGLNNFADWTWQEFQRHRLGAAQNCSATLKGNHKLTNEAIPESELGSLSKLANCELKL